MKIQKIRKIIVFALFYIILMASFLWKVAGREEMSLNGVTETVEKPVITLKNIMNGEWQLQYEAWYDEQFNLKAPLIATLNEFVWKTFHITTNDNLVVGNGNNLFEKWYITTYLQLANVVEQEYFDTKMAQLIELQQRLEKQGKHLMLYITPSKAEIYPEDIPWNYMLCSNRTQKSNYEKLIEVLEDSGVPYYDSVPYVKELKDKGDFPVYPKTGIHWTQVTGSFVAQKLSDAIEEEFGYDLNELRISYQQCEQPISPDADIFSTMNLKTEPYDVYYEPIYELLEDGKDKPNVFIRGGSFLGQTVNHLINSNCFGTNVHMENTNVFVNYYSQVSTMSSYDELNWDELIGDKELFIIEVNQGAIQDMGFGIIEYLLTKIE